MVKIKTKLTLGVGLLFTLILLLSGVATMYLHQLKADTENILVANYQSLEYSRNMLTALENPTQENLEKFQQNLQLQENNITEISEPELTRNIRKGYQQLAQSTADSLVKATIKQNVFALMEMNMQAIQRKSEVAHTTADKAVLWIAVTGTLCFFIAFILLINLPASIANPIQTLTQSIQQIAIKKYTERVHFQSNSEFGELAKSFNIMAEKLEEYNNSNLAKIVQEKQRIETLINTMYDPVLGLDENQQIIFANEQAIHIANVPHENLVGKNATEIALQNDLIRSLINDLHTPNQTDESTLKTPIRISTHNKESYFEKEIIPISIVPTGETTAKMVGHVIFLRNVTSYKELDFAKTNFIATVSHEFKTPIAAIKMSLQLLAMEKVGILNTEQKQLLESIGDDANRLLKITSELLNVTQIESGKMQLAIQPTPVHTLLQYAVKATHIQALEKQVQVHIPPQTHDILVQADYDKTAWVLTNLISNAIRYSYEYASVQIHIIEKPNSVEIMVQDTGQGIAPQYLDKIFNRYFKVPGTKKEGTGLGLAISKEFMEAQGGSIQVQSEFGAGSIFTISIPTVPATHS